MSREFGMIAGGTGITPMYQIITHILYNKQDPTRINLIYANVNKEDILLKLELDELAARNKDRFSVYYVLNNPPDGWTGGVGFVTTDMIKEKIAGPTGDKRLLICGKGTLLLIGLGLRHRVSFVGPPPMVTAMKKNLGELNYPPAQTISKVNDTVRSIALSP